MGNNPKNKKKFLRFNLWCKLGILAFSWFCKGGKMVNFDFVDFFTAHLWTFAIASLVIVVVYSKGIAPFRVLKNAFGDKIPGPTPLPFVGNMLDAIKHKGEMHLQVDEYYKKYGKVFGMYTFGSLPSLVISDLEMVKQVYVKNFNSFRERPVFLKFPEPLNSMLTVVGFEDWKRIRNTLTPTFSAHKMKQMVPLMNMACDTLMKKMQELSTSGESFDITKYYQGLTMDVILLCAFGINADSQNNPDEPAIVAAKRAVDGSASQRIALTILTLLPFGDKLVEMFPSLVMSNFTDLVNIAQRIVATKKAADSTSSRKDLLDLMLIGAQDESLPDSKKLSDAEVLAQSVIFLIAGYETSSNTLSFTCYHLATHPEVQQKLQEKIDGVWPDEDNIPSYETVRELPYLDMVISETLRLYPPAILTIRQCAEDCELKNLHVPKGITIVLPIYSMHRDPVLWPDPKKFNPERFTPEAKKSRDPYAYQPFGHGPHNCIGMRFAQMQIKLVLAQMVKKYSFEVTPDTNIPPDVTVRATLGAKEIKLKIRLRK